jgi:hypothetical protein
MMRGPPSSFLTDAEVAEVKPEEALLLLLMLFLDAEELERSLDKSMIPSFFLSSVL